MQPLTLLLAAVSAFAATATPAQDYPSRPIRMVVPTSPGGVTDIVAKTIAPQISEALRDRRQHAGRVRRLDPQRVRQVEQGDPGAEHHC